MIRRLAAIAILLVLMSGCGGSGDTVVDEIGGICTPVPAARTTAVDLGITLDASDAIRAGSVANVFTTEGNVIGVAQIGLQTATTTFLASNAFALPLATDFSVGVMTLDVSLAMAGENNGTVSVLLDMAAGVPDQVDTLNDLRTLASAIAAQLSFPTVDPLQTAIDVNVSTQDLGSNNFRLIFSAVVEGEASEIQVSNFSGSAAEIGLLDSLASTSGSPVATNGYPAQAIDVVSPLSTVTTYNSGAAASASTTATELLTLTGVLDARATTQATIMGYNNSNGSLRVNLNGVSLAGTSLSALADEINSLAGSDLPGLEASFNNGELLVIDEGGGDLLFRISGNDDGDFITVIGNLGAESQTLEIDSSSDGVASGNRDGSTHQIVVGGEIEIVLTDGYTFTNPQPSVGIYQPNIVMTQTVLSEFSAADPTSYNHLETDTIYDSLGVSHTLQMYFVRLAQTTIGSQEFSRWQLNVEINGAEVGDPDNIANLSTTPASYNLFFDDLGVINTQFSDPVFISNWTPLNASAEPTGADGPLPVAQGGSLPIPNPPSSSNFVINTHTINQVGESYMLFTLEQNGNEPSFCN